jgi:hypothetical protein
MIGWSSAMTTTGRVLWSSIAASRVAMRIAMRHHP